MNPFADPNPGDHIPTDRRLWTAIVGAAREHAQPNRPGEPPAGRRQTGYVEALAFNDTGADLEEFHPAKVIGTADVDLDVDDQVYDWARRPVVSLGVPTGPADWVAVALESIPDGQYGRAAVAGLTACWVDVTDDSHEYASPGTTTDHLVSGSTGSVRMLPAVSTGSSSSSGTPSVVQRRGVFLGGCCDGEAAARPYALDLLPCLVPGPDGIPAGLAQRWVYPDEGGIVRCLTSGMCDSDGCSSASIDDPPDPEEPPEPPVFGEVNGTVTAMPSGTPQLGRVVSAATAFSTTFGTTTGVGYYTINDVSPMATSVTASLGVSGGESPSYSVNGGTWYAGSSVTFAVVFGGGWIHTVDWRIYAEGLNPDPVEEGGEGPPDPP